MINLEFRKTFLSGVVASALVVAPLIVAAGTASADTSTWSSTNSATIDLSNYDALGNTGELNGVSCFTGTSCVAAGDAPAGGSTNPIELSGDAQTWGVSGGGVVTNGAVTDTTGGSTLSYLDVHDTDYNGATIQSISCLSTLATCVSVGYDGLDEPYLLIGNPNSWSNATSYELLDGITPASTMEAPEPNPDEAYLESVSCLPNGDGEWCTAVGYDETSGQAIEISGDPTTWDTSPITELPVGTSVTAGLDGVSCVGVGECVAVGNEEVPHPSIKKQSRSTTSVRHSSIESPYYFLSYNGDPTTWADSDPSLTPNTSGYSGTLNGVSCTSSSFCEAVGYSHVSDITSQDTTPQPVLFTGDPTTWGSTYHYATYTLGDSFGDGYGGELEGVSCPTSSYCAAVGYDGNSEVGEEPIVLSGDPSTWAGDAWSGKSGNVYATELDATPQSQNDYTLGYFNGVSCTAVDTCVAVGHFDDYYSGEIRHASSVSARTALSPPAGPPTGPFTAWIAAPAATPTYSAPAPVLYPVTYLPGGGTGTPPTQASLNAGATFTVASPSSLTYTGETFTGWSDGTTVYQPGSTYTMPAAPVTLTAQWTPTATPASNTPPSKALLRAEVLFPFNKYYLTAHAKKQLLSFARKIVAAKVTNFRVVGSTDLFGSEGYNIPLSEHRAHAVSDYLTAQLASLGVHDVVFHDTWIGILKTQPTYTQNRRTVVAD